MRCRLLLPTVLLLLSPSLHAQENPTTDDVLSTYLRRSYAAVARDLTAAVEMMPAEDFDYRPDGVADEVRTFGEHVAHLLSVNMWVCAMGDGQPASTAKPETDKASLTALMTETNERCTAYLDELTDEVLSEEIRSGAGEREMKAVRGNSVIFVVAHANETYGNIVAYLRLKGLVPPRTASQASFLSLVTPPAS